ncbi:hypothetical protein HGP17_10130 [Rhizobium sp. P38BS-XIX]|uniref:DUF6894 family protein n=1 Tax=Rhizobium sp. P38BS-XIX TaxID=2726740 RepID=UPI001456DB51|nr:hypothetical protein [Rhizobium sp. P38BS-XIX]NLR97191.1 hypothetical protein [Rhizobium sp. P38BS-XIX]
MEQKMPRYYFHVRSHEGLQRDIEGSVFDTADQAQVEAVNSAREIVGARIAAGESADGDTFIVEDENGNIVFQLPFRSVVRFD